MSSRTSAIIACISGFVFGQAIYQAVIANLRLHDERAKAQVVSEENRIMREWLCLDPAYRVVEGNAPPPPACGSGDCEIYNNRLEAAP